jgi:hypothetical protein
MLLQDKQSDDVSMLINPSETMVSGRSQSGEEEQDPEDYAKTSLIFPSGENLPRCWVDADYRQRLGLGPGK